MVVTLGLVGRNRGKSSKLTMNGPCSPQPPVGVAVADDGGKALLALPVVGEVVVTAGVSEDCVLWVSGDGAALEVVAVIDACVGEFGLAVPCASERELLLKFPGERVNAVRVDSDGLPEGDTGRGTFVVDAEVKLFATLGDVEVPADDEDPGLG